MLKWAKHSLKIAANVTTKLDTFFTFGSNNIKFNNFGRLLMPEWKIGISISTCEVLLNFTKLYLPSKYAKLALYMATAAR